MGMPRCLPPPASPPFAVLPILSSAPTSSTQASFKDPLIVSATRRSLPASTCTHAFYSCSSPTAQLSHARLRVDKSATAVPASARVRWLWERRGAVWWSRVHARVRRHSIGFCPRVRCRSRNLAGSVTETGVVDVARAGGLRGGVAQELPSSQPVQRKRLYRLAGTSRELSLLPTLCRTEHFCIALHPKVIRCTFLVGTT